MILMEEAAHNKSKRVRYRSLQSSESMIHYRPLDHFISNSKHALDKVFSGS